MGFKARPPAGSDFDQVYARLRDILAAHAPALVVKRDTDENYYLESPVPYEGRDLFFGSVRKGKRYVSYHLFPIYMSPTLLSTTSPELKKRMQGKSCFNFTKMDEATISELADLTRRGLESWKSRGLV